MKRSKDVGRGFNVPLGYNMSKNHSIVIKKGFVFLNFCIFEKLISQVKGDIKYFIHLKSCIQHFQSNASLQKERERKIKEEKIEEARKRGGVKQNR